MVLPPGDWTEAATSTCYWWLVQKRGRRIRPTCCIRLSVSIVDMTRQKENLTDWLSEFDWLRFENFVKITYMCMNMFIINIYIFWNHVYIGPFLYKICAFMHVCIQSETAFSTPFLGLDPFCSNNLVFFKPIFKMLDEIPISICLPICDAWLRYPSPEGVALQRLIPLLFQTNHG